MSEYAHRDPAKLEPHFSKHMRAMTEEGLHRKAAIAAELAFRDAMIECQQDDLDGERQRRQRQILEQRRRIASIQATHDKELSEMTAATRDVRAYNAFKFAYYLGVAHQTLGEARDAEPLYDEWSAQREADEESELQGQPKLDQEQPPG